MAEQRGVRRSCRLHACCHDGGCIGHANRRWCRPRAPPCGRPGPFEAAVRLALQVSAGPALAEDATDVEAEPRGRAIRRVGHQRDGWRRSPETLRSSPSTDPWSIRIAVSARHLPGNRQEAPVSDRCAQGSLPARHQPWGVETPPAAQGARMAWRVTRPGSHHVRSCPGVRTCLSAAAALAPARRDRDFTNRFPRIGTRPPVGRPSAPFAVLLEKSR